MAQIEELDGYVETREVEQLTGFCRRWIYERVKAGKFPAPEVQGHRGSPHKWRRSTIRRALNEMEAQSRDRARAAA